MAKNKWQFDKHITKDSEITAELAEAFNKFQLTEWPDDDAVDGSKLKNLEWLISEAGDSEEELDSNYLTNNYYLEIGDIKLERSFSQYRKDGGLCEGEWCDGISIYNKKS